MEPSIESPSLRNSESSAAPAKSNVFVAPPTTRLIDLTLMGQKITLRAPAEAETADEVVQLVRERLKEAESRMKAGFAAPHLPAILALFELAGEYLEAKKKVQAHQDALHEKVEHLRTFLSE